jgi:predicted GIY-YIG superfamily endonuclease
MRPHLGLILRDAAKTPLLRMRGRIARGGDRMAEGAYLYILRCSDGSFYIGTTRTVLELRVAQHNAGIFGGYTATRRPVALIFSQWFDRITRRFRSITATISTKITVSFETPAYYWLI